MQTRVQKWGNSLGVRIPRSLADELGVSPGSEVNLSTRGGELILKPTLPARLHLDDLLEAVTPANLHGEVESGHAIGREIV